METKTDGMADFARMIAADNGYALKRIYAPKDRVSATACILVGYCPDTLAHFQAIYEEAKKSFPHLTPEMVTCGKVHESSYVKGFTLVIFDCPRKKVKGWEYYESGIDFYW